MHKCLHDGRLSSADIADKHETVTHETLLVQLNNLVVPVTLFANQVHVLEIFLDFDFEILPIGWLK